MTAVEPNMDVKIDARRAGTGLRTLLDVIGGKMPTDPFTAPAAQATPQATTAPSSPANSQPFEGEAPQTGAFGEDRGGRAHAGIDFGVPSGTSILSMSGGTVREVGSDADGYGNYVVVDHGGGISTRYAHLTSASVAVGQTVGAGQAVGASGSTGKSTGPHLHFEVLKDGQAIDPSPYLAGSAAIVGSAEGQSPGLSLEQIAGAQIQNVLDVLSGKPAQEIGTTTTGTHPAATGVDFFGQVLAGIGAPDTPENRRALNAWARAEGMDAAHNNPFATTWDTETGDRPVNSHGVRSYSDQSTGVQATIKTLTNGLYNPIIAALRAGVDAMSVAAAIENSPWGTGGLVKKILAEG